MSFDFLAIILSIQLSMHLVHMSARVWRLTNAQRVFFQNIGCLLQNCFLAVLARSLYRSMELF